VALAICLLFDRRTDRAIRDLWQRLEESGVSTLLTHTHGKHVPHLSYAVLRSFDVGAVQAALSSLEPGAPLPLQFDCVGHFRRGRAALIPAVTTEAMSRQARIVDAVLSTGADLHHYYRPGLWVPHTSIATRVRGEHLATLTTAAHDILPLDATADRAVLIDSGSGERWPVDAVL
jgi:2'-5' RNA ligase